MEIVYACKNGPLGVNGYPGCRESEVVEPRRAKEFA